MSARTEPRALRRRQLDRLFAAPVDLHNLARPREGWIRETRRALGMSAAALAGRLGVRQPTVAKLEQSEAADTITLASLRRAADALGCTLVHAFVPRRSLETFLAERAELVARRLVGRVAHTMTLEAQAGDAAARDAQIADLAAELVRTLSTELWNDALRDSP